MKLLIIALSLCFSNFAKADIGYLCKTSASAIYLHLSDTEAKLVNFQTQELTTFALYGNATTGQSGLIISSLGVETISVDANLVNHKMNGTMTLALTERHVSMDYPCTISPL